MLRDDIVFDYSSVAVLVAGSKRSLNVTHSYSRGFRSLNSYKKDLPTRAMSSLITDGLGSSDSPFLSRQATAASLLNVNIIDNNFELSPIDKYLAPLSARSQLARDILQDGTVAELKEFLLDSDNVKLLNSLDEEGASLLHFSARLNRAEATRVLIDRGADVDIRLRDGSTPLHVAAR